MCKIWTSKARFLGHFGPQSKSNFWCLITFSKVFTTVLLHMLIASTFRCVENMGLICPMFWPLYPQNKSKFLSLVIFSHIFQWFRISLIVNVNLRYFWRYVEYWPQRPNFRVILGPQINHNSGLQSFSQIFSFGFTSFLSYMLIGGTFVCIFNYVPKGSISGPRVKAAAELVRPSGFLYKKGQWL